MEALEALGINLPGLLWHTVNFLVLVYLLTRFLYRPVVRLLDERADRIKESMDRAAAVQAELANAGEEARRQLETVRRESQAIIEQAGQVGERVKEQARQEAQAEADKIVARARAQMEQERQATVSELRREMADLVVEAAGKVIGQSMDDGVRRRLVDEFTRGNGPRLN